MLSDIYRVHTIYNAMVTDSGKYRCIIRDGKYSSNKSDKFHLKYERKTVGVNTVILCTSYVHVDRGAQDWYS